MSRIAIEGRSADQPVTVVIGWDRPTQSCFLQLELSDEQVDNPALASAADVSLEMLFKPLSLAEVEDGLHRANVLVPEAAFAVLKEHVTYDVGNVSLKFDAAGNCTQVG